MTEDKMVGWLHRLDEFEHGIPVLDGRFVYMSL